MLSLFRFCLFHACVGTNSAEGASVVLERCAAAVASGDGRELFTFQAGGQIANVAGDKCLGVRDDVAAEGSEVVLTACDEALRWEVGGNGQLKVKAPEGLCLSQAGLAPGIVDVAAKAGVMASSTVNALSHGAEPFLNPALVGCYVSFDSRAGASMAVDDNAATYWASKFDDTSSPVEYVIDFGESQKLHSIELAWEFPARNFAIAYSVDGVHFTDVYATDANVLKTSRIALGHVVARKLRISMTEVCCL